MFKKLIVLLTFIWTGCYASITPDYNKTEKYLVYNGYIPNPEADLYTKYMVSIAHLGMFDVNKIRQFGAGHFCAGIIIGSRTILTAAHCMFRYKVQHLVVIAGTPVRTRKTKSTQILSVVHKIVYPLYVDKESSSHDLGVLYLNDTLKEYAGKVMIYRDFKYSGCAVKRGTKCTLIGWGKVGNEGKLPKQVRYIDLVVLRKKVCDKRLYAFEKTFCAGKSKGAPGGGCKGDSGGPVFCEGILRGITASGVNCSEADPTYFPNLCEYMNWIKDNSLDSISYRSSSGSKLHVNILYFQMLSIIIILFFE